MGWDGRTLPFFCQRTRQGAQSPATYFPTHSGFDPEPTEIHRCLFLDFRRFKYFPESLEQACSAEGCMAFEHILAFEHIWRATQEYIVVLSEIMQKKKVVTGWKK